MNDSTTFNNELAGIVGIEKAILLQRIYYFIEHNRNTNKNIIENHVWMYDTAKAFCTRFPFLKEGSVYRWLAEMEKDGWIVSANFNKRKNDKTKWYRYGKRMIEFLQKTDSQNESPKNEENENNENGSKSDSQIESETLSGSQNDGTNSQNERTISQNGGTLPIKSLKSPKTDTTRRTRAETLQDSGYRSKAFSEFWKLYPKQKKEFTAWQEWQTQGIDNLPHVQAKIFESLKAFKQSRDWNEQNGRFIPFAHNWLRDRRYNEFPEAEDEVISIVEQHQTKMIGD